MAAFTRLWSGLAQEWLRQDHIDEYNGIKHGLRVIPGGFHVALGQQDAPNVPAPPERMVSLGGSDFGSRFFVARCIAGALPVRGGDPHFRIRRQALNWNPQALVRALQLVSLSIGNLKAFLLIASGVDPTAVRFTRPAEAAAFKEPWANPPGVLSMDFDVAVHEAHITRVSREELWQVIERSMHPTRTKGHDDAEEA